MFNRFRILVTVNNNFSSVEYVPKHNPVTSNDVDVFKSFLNRHERILVLTGAGISTESGIPDYRSEEVGLYARSNHKPVQYQEFVKNPDARKRYWARNFVGWPRFSNIQPNQTHLSLAQLENVERKVSGVVTQNVDRLHTKAGSRNVVELHGSSYTVKCLNCDYEISRYDFQGLLTSLNPNMKETSNFIRPDGDVELKDNFVSGFKVPACPNCDGLLKPDIVFFGDNVPKERVNRVVDMVSSSDSLLVLGSSLSVFSSYRILLQAQEAGLESCAVNIGPIRGQDKMKTIVNVKCGDLFSQIMSC